MTTPSPTARLTLRAVPMQALELLEKVLQKFPAPLVDARFAFFFLPLAARLAAEPAQTCRRHVAAALGALLRRVTADSRAAAAEWACKWLAAADARLRAAGAQVRTRSATDRASLRMHGIMHGIATPGNPKLPIQASYTACLAPPLNCPQRRSRAPLTTASSPAALQVAGQLIDAEGKAFAKRLAPLQPLVLARLQAACEASNGDGDAAPGWQEAYFLALFVEKLFAAAPQALEVHAGEGASDGSWAREVRMHACMAAAPGAALTALHRLTCLSVS